MTEQLNTNPRLDFEAVPDAVPINTLTYTTEYHSAQVTLSLNDLENVLTRIYCNLTAVDNFGNKLVIGSDIALGEPNPSSFINFDSITKDQIDTWVKATEDYHQLEQKIIVGMNLLVKPTIVIKPLNF